MMQLSNIKSLIKDDFQAVDDLITRSVQSKASIINDLGNYIVQSGGKRIRPLVLLTTARACGYQGDQHIALSVVLEFIHTATLLHDDVVDNSSCRRGQKTANTIWGNEAAILVGDFLYSKALQILNTAADSKIIQVIADATNTMAEGEAFQLLDRHNPKTTEKDYLNVIRCKTAKLFEAATKVSALLAKCEPAMVEKIADYGLHLGTAFQLIDDLLDFQDAVEQTGKMPGNDLAEGKVTLPLIYILQSGTAKEIQIIEEAIQAENGYSFSVVREILESRGAFEYTRQFATNEAKKAELALVDLKPSPYKEALHALMQFAIHRDH